MKMPTYQKEEKVLILARTDHLGESDLQMDQRCYYLKDTLLALSDLCQVHVITMHENLPAILANFVR
jgi:hypothetical protein